MKGHTCACIGGICTLIMRETKKTRVCKIEKSKNKKEIKTKYRTDHKHTLQIHQNIMVAINVYK